MGMQHIMTTRQKIKQTINRNRIQFSSTSPSVHPLKYQRPSQDWNKRSTGTDDVFYPIDPIDLIDWWSLDRQFNRLWLGIIFFLLNEYQPSVKASKAKEEDFVMSTTAQSIQSRTTSQWGEGRNRKKMRDKVERVLFNYRKENAKEETRRAAVFIKKEEKSRKWSKRKSRRVVLKQVSFF